MTEEIKDIEVVDMVPAAETETERRHPPGAMLAKARLALGYSVSDIAMQLRLPKYVIESIDVDTYDKLPSHSFVRGYLRAYARIVGLAGDEIVSKFDALGLTESCQYFSPTVIVKNQKSLNDRSMRWLTYVIAFILISLVFLWWRGHSGFEVASVQEQTVTSVTDNVGDLPLPEQNKISNA